MVNAIHLDNTYRPFRHHRPGNLFNGHSWMSFLSTSCKNISHYAQEYGPIKKITQFAKSVLGTVLIYTSIETVGAYLGGFACAKVVGNAGSAIGQAVAPHIIMLGILAGGSVAIYSFAAKASLINRLFFTSTAIVSITLWYAKPDQILEYGGDIGFDIGDQIGHIAGSILGGYGALLLAKSPVLFWDRNSVWDSYSICMIRYHAMGIVFDSCIVMPTTYLGTLLFRLPRRGIKWTLQNTAFSSNIILPFVVKCIQRSRVSREVLLPFVAKLITNKYYENSSTLFAEKLTQLISPIATFLPTIMQKLIRYGFEEKMEQIFKSISKNSDFIVVLALRSFHQYATLFKKSEKITEAFNNFQDSFYKKKHLRELHKEQLINAVKEEIKQDSIYFRKAQDFVLNRLWIDETMTKIIAEVISKIEELEIELVGFPLLSKNRSEYLNEIVKIYLQYYFIFTLLNYEKFANELIPSEESSLIIDLNSMVVSFYVGSIAPPIVTNVAHCITRKAIQLIFKIKGVLSFCLQQPEHQTYLRGRQNVKFIEEHIPRPFSQEEDSSWEHIIKEELKIDDVDEVSSNEICDDQAESTQFTTSEGKNVEIVKDYF